MKTLLLALLLSTPAHADDAADVRTIHRMYTTYRVAFLGIDEVDATDVGDALLVDVRPVEERLVSMLPGAVPAEAVEADPTRYAGRRMVAYCTIGYRSGLWTRKQARQGLDVANLRGGILAWTHLGGELVDANGPTHRVHVYGERWDLAADSYQAVW